MELLIETVNRVAMDCVELSEAYQEQEADVFKGYCHMYLPFVDKRYQVLQEIKKASIRMIGIPLNAYYESLMKEIEELMGMLLRQEIEEIEPQIYLLLSLCYESYVEFFSFTTIPFERYCPETPEKMKKRVNEYIQNRNKDNSFNEKIERGKIIQFVSIHR